MDLQLQKFDQYIILIKNAKGKSLEPVISHLLSDPEIYTFCYFLKEDNINELKVETHPLNPLFELLQIFSSGTYQNYLEKSKKLPPLTENQTKKLRKLTILEMASKNKILFYDDLFKALNLQEERDLEEIIIDMIYRDLITCKINQKKREIKVSACKGRDMKAGEIKEIKQNIKKILDKTTHIENLLLSQVEFINKEKAKHLEEQKKYEMEKNERKNNILKETVQLSQKETEKWLSDFKAIAFRGETRK